MKLLKSLKIVKLGRNKTFKKVGLIVGLTVVSIGLLVFGFNFAYKDKIFPQTFIGGVNVGGLSKQQAKKTLESTAAQNSKSEVKLKYLDQTWVVTAEDLKIDYKISDSIDRAWSYGREGSFGEIFIEQLKSIFGGNQEMIVYDCDKAILSSKINNIAEKIDISVKDASINIEDLRPVVIEEQEGQKLNFALAMDEVLASFGNLKKKPEINLAVDKVTPKVNSAAAQLAASQVKDILKSKVVLKSDKKDYILEPNDVATYLDFVAVPKEEVAQKIDLKNVGEQKKPQWALAVAVNSAKLSELVNGISGEVNQEPQDAKFAIENGQVKAFALSQTGYQLDQTKSKIIISAAILNDKKTVVLPIKVTQPEITSDSAASLGLVEMIGEGTTSWRGSPQNRIHNLTLGTANISGTIVKPGEEFSTVKAIGAIDAETGFLPELVIKNGNQVVPDYGGGLCQVSTTLFRAALNSGMQITERTNHSFRVSYYEPPVGMDATIYDPAPDFKFVNNMKKPILVWGFAGSNSLTFQIYGTKDNRKIEISDPWVGDYVSPGAPVYTESASMEPGAIRQVERALAGCTATFTYKVTSALGEVLQDEKFVSKYIALSNSYLVGPGYQAPPPEAPPAG